MNDRKLLFQCDICVIRLPKHYDVPYDSDNPKNTKLVNLCDNCYEVHNAKCDWCGILAIYTNLSFNLNNEFDRWRLNLCHPCYWKYYKLNS
jgi:hypothetical protein